MKKILKSTIRSLPNKPLIFKVIRWLHPPSFIYKHLYFKGQFKVKVTSSEFFLINHSEAQLENQLFWDGLFNSWEGTSLKIWVELCRKSKSIFDIGANTGIYSLTAKAVNKNSNVYAFEPVKRVYQKLVENIRINSYSIDTYELGLSNYDGEASIYDTGNEHIYSVTINKNLNPENTLVYESRVKVNRFISWFQKYNIKGMDLVKIDVETHEPEVIEGMISQINSFKPSIFLEVLNDEIADRLNILLDLTGYMVFDICEKKFGLKRIDKIKKSSGYNILLCTPEVFSCIQSFEIK